MSTGLLDLPKRMRALMCYGPYDYRLEEIPVPRVQPGEVLVRVLGAGICAGDVKCFAGAPLFWGDDVRQGYCQPPVTPGHEFVGEVVALGDGAGEKYGLTLGDLAISEQIVPCWQCRFCLTRPVLDVRCKARRVWVSPTHSWGHGGVHVVSVRCHQS